MPITSSFVLGPAQADGRRYVTESHILDDGRTLVYEYLSDGVIDPQLILEERSVVINNSLAARAAARAVVEETSVPLTQFEFLSRFTTAERIAIRDRAKTDPIVEDFLDLMQQADYVSLPVAMPGLNYLASVGVLTIQRVAAIEAE